MTTSRPEADELEITLLGPGTGESVVLHLGDNRWMIVDSFEEDGLPAARSYLDGIQVEPEVTGQVAGSQGVPLASWVRAS
jgi:hypothetical protein